MMKRTDRNRIGNVEDKKKRKISEKNDFLSTRGSGIASNQSSDNEEDQENSESDNGEVHKNSESDNEEDEIELGILTHYENVLINDVIKMQCIGLCEEFHPNKQLTQEEKNKLQEELRYYVECFNHLTECRRSNDGGCKEKEMLQRMYLDLKKGRLSDQKKNLYITALFIHSTQCISQSCQDFLPCNEIRKILRDPCEANFSRCHGHVVYSNTYCFWSETRIHLSKDYNIFFKETINSGTYSNVSRQWLRRDTYEAAMAVKQTTENIAADLLIARCYTDQELNILFPQVIMQVETSGLMFIKLGECSLFDYIKHLESNKKSLEEQCALIYIKHVLDGIDTLHNVYRLHHGDIKSKNVILMDHFQRAVLADFDSVQEIGKEVDSGKMRGTLGYIPNECLQSSRLLLTGAIDIFAFGVVTSEILLSHNLEIPKYSHRTYKQQLSMRITWILENLHKYRSSTLDFAGFVRQCLESNANQRPSARELKEQISSMYEHYSNQLKPIPEISLSSKACSQDQMEDFLRLLLKRHLKTLPTEFPRQPFVTSARDSLIPQEEVHH